MHADIAAFDALPNTSQLAVALTGGAVQLRYLPPTKQVRKERPVAPKPGNFRVFKPQKPGKRERWNQRLTKFEYGEALDLTVGMIDELDRILDNLILPL